MGVFFWLSLLGAGSGTTDEGAVQEINVPLGVKAFLVPPAKNTGCQCRMRKNKGREAQHSSNSVLNETTRTWRCGLAGSAGVQLAAPTRKQFYPPLIPVEK